MTPSTWNWGDVRVRSLGEEMRCDAVTERPRLDMELRREALRWGII